MGIYQLGQAVTITETFRLLGTPTNPTTTTFTVQDPVGVDVDYVMGVAPEVTNPSAGVFVLALDPPALPGDYPYEVVGTGAVEATGTGLFTVLQSSVAPQDVPFPQFGPAIVWIDAQDIQGQCDVAEADIPLLPGIAAAASQIMFQVSARQYTGRMSRTVRPVESLGGNCWGWGAGFGAWAWTGWPWAWGYDGVAWGWIDGAGSRCNCRPLSRVLLPGYPVVEITEVKIDGDVVATDGYRLDEWRYLTRMRDSANPNRQQFWPGCQILDLPDTEPGTWSVSYVSGIDPPLIGKMAAAALACELLPGSDCKLPTGVRQIVRSGVTIDKIQPLADMLRKGATGIVAIDAFIAAYNPNGLQRRPTVWSPDGPRFATRVGQ